MTAEPRSVNIDDIYDDYYQGPISDHFDGEKFFNPWNPRPKKGLREVFKWRMEGERGAWPDEAIPLPAFTPPPQSSDEMRITYIGHASFLVQVSGKNILIDPVFSERASPFAFIGPKRISPPAISLENLPKIDAVFVSHNHYDHMDLPSLAALSTAHRPHYYTPLGNPRLIKPVIGKSAITAMDWHDVADLDGDVSITVVPAQHWSRRGLNDTSRDLWGGCIIKSNKTGESVYYMGDSGFHEGMFKDMHTKYGSPTLALLAIGAYEPRWFMSYSHMNPEEAVFVHKILKPKKSMGFHFEVFQLTDESFDAPRKFTTELLDKHKIEQGAFLIPELGDSMTA